MDIRKKLLPRTLVKFNGIVCIQFANLQNRHISEKDCNFTFRLPNSMDDTQTKLTDPLNPKKLKLWSKAMSNSELKFFIDTFILGHPVEKKCL